MANANTTQVGGTHYKTQHQHWDMAANCHLGYFEGQITKYITRHRFKKGKEDADKALHFVGKLIELAWEGQQPMWQAQHAVKWSSYGTANKLTPLELAIVMGAATWRTVGDLVTLREAVMELIEETYGGGPGPAYVNQDQGAST